MPPPDFGRVFFSSVLRILNEKIRAADEGGISLILSREFS
jgi:hypothetical protein